MKLPDDFCEKMKNLLGKEYDAFLKGYENENYFSLRVNTLKGDVQSLLSKQLFDFTPVPWCESGFYYSADARPGRHALHSAGAYYIQEASAMSVVEAAQIKKGEKVLDLCASPGGKTTQAACKLDGTGLLVCNEIVPSRAKILSGNVERMGIKNAIVINESPSKLESFFPDYFDKIIVDAPCSGEGMFRKDQEAANQWSVPQVEVCANRQRLILESAHKMLAENGQIIYSTCTFSPEENEQTVEGFLSAHSEYILVKPFVHSFFTSGNPAWANGDENLEKTMRLFPHKLKGEGHFVAVMEKTSGKKSRIAAAKTVKDKKTLVPWLEFSKKYLKDMSFENYIAFGDTLYGIDCDVPDLSKLKVLRAGLQMGEIKKDRFEPSHSLGAALKENQAAQVQNFLLDDPRLLAYLKGETVKGDCDFKGWCLVCADGYSLGWAKGSDGILKNHYPKGLRIMGV